MKERLQHTGKEKLKIPVQPGQVEMATFGTLTHVDLHSAMGPFLFAPEYETAIPPSVIAAVGHLVEMNTDAFAHLVPRNTEGDSLAYQHCAVPSRGVVEPFFQVDMVATSSDFLTQAAGEDSSQIAAQLKNRIFEFEPSIAMYELIHAFGANGDLGAHFRRDLDVLRLRHGKRIALLAPTAEKFSAVLASEFGLSEHHGLSQEELSDLVKEVSGFDTVLGPDDFIDHLNANDGECEFLLFVRPSDPVAKLKDPTALVNSPLLGDEKLRRIIRRNAITLNIDNPDWGIADPRKIKDSKAALPLLGMGLSLRNRDQVHKLDLSVGLQRAKPRGGVFGAYGQKPIDAQNESHRLWLAEQIELRGPYLIQPEMAPLLIIDSSSSRQFLAMDRLFFSMVSGTASFMGGIRILNPVESSNAKHGRLHGSSDMISAPIVAGM